MSDSFFAESFGAYVCDGDTITATVDGFTLTATVHNDDSGRLPWDDCGHGPVSDWTSRAKAPGELILASDRGSHRFYDFAAAVTKARAESWNAAPYDVAGETRRQRAERAAMSDYSALKAFCDDQWHYVGVAVTVSRHDVQLTGDYDAALWGIDANYPGSDNSYLVDVANDLAGEALEAARAKLASLCDCAA